MSRKFEISNVEYDLTSVRPVILNFQHGTISKGFEKNLNSQIYEYEKHKYSVEAIANNVRYYDKINRSEDTYNNFIAIPNKNGNQVRLIAVDYTDLVAKFDDDATTFPIDKEANTQFNSKKVKKSVDRRKKLKQDIKLFKDSFEATIIAAITSADNDVTNETDDYRPKINTNATEVSDIYNLNDIGIRHLLRKLSKEVKRIRNESDMSTCNYITNKLLAWKNSGDKKVTAQLWLYADCLIKFLLASNKMIGIKEYSPCSYSETMSQDILQRFTLLGTGRYFRLRPKIMKDKTVLYILIVCLTASNFKLSLIDLAIETKISLRRLQELSKLLRFHVSGANVTLQLPLPPENLNIKKERKRKMAK